MTIENQPDPLEPAEQPVPRWVGVMIAVLLVGSMVAAGGYWAWSRATQPSRSELVEVAGLPLIRSAIAAPPPSNVQRLTLPNNQVGYQVRASDSMAQAQKAPADPEWRMTFRYNRSDLMTPDQTAAITARFRLTSDPAFAKSLKVTEAQIASLKEVPNTVPMIVSPANEKRMKDAINAYHASPQAAAEQGLVKLLGEISAASLPATRTAITERVKQIQAILTPEQVAPFKP
jgi:hypothetical protein